MKVQDVKSSGYLAYQLTPQAREQLLAAFPPKFSDVIAHHVTVAFGVPRPDADTLGGSKVVTVVGYVCDESLEAVVVTVDGFGRRPDGKVFHITLSLDRSQGRKPVDSNAVIAMQPIQKVDPINLRTTLRYL